MFKTKVKSEQIFFIIYITLLIEIMFANVKIISNVLRYLEYVSMFALLVYIIWTNKTKYSKESFIKLFIYGAVILITALVANNKQLLKVMLLIVAFKEINFEDFLKKDFKYRLIFCCIVILLSFLGLTEVHNTYRDNGLVRYSLGFVHPNILGLQTLSLCLEYLYIHRKDKKIKQFIFVIITLIFNIFVTDSRACIIALILSFIYLCLDKILSNIYNIYAIRIIVENIYTILFTICAVFAFLFTQNGNNFVNKIDNLLSGRLYCANYYTQTCNVFSPFGNYVERLDKDIDGDNSKYLPLDIGYIHLLIRYGIIMMVLLLYLYYQTLNQAYENKNYTLITIFVILAFYSTMETNAMLDIYNPFLFAFSAFFYNNIKGLNIEESVNGKIS